MTQRQISTTFIRLRDVKTWAWRAVAVLPNVDEASWEWDIGILGAVRMVGGTFP